MFCYVKGRILIKHHSGYLSNLHFADSMKTFYDSYEFGYLLLHEWMFFDLFLVLNKRSRKHSRKCSIIGKILLRNFEICTVLNIDEFLRVKLSIDATFQIRIWINLLSSLSNFNEFWFLFVSLCHFAGVKIYLETIIFIFLWLILF